MIVLRLTSVGMACGRVSSLTIFIMIAGPMATTSSIFSPASTSSCSAWVTKPLAAVAAVVGHDDDAIGGAPHLVFHDDELAAAPAEDRDDLVARRLEGLGDGVGGRDADAAADDDDRPHTVDVRRAAEWAAHVRERLARLHVGHDGGGLAHFLNDEGECIGAGVGDGERDALGVVARSNDDELPGAPRPGDFGRPNDVAGDARCQSGLLEYFVHCDSPVGPPMSSHGPEESPTRPSRSEKRRVAVAARSAVNLKLRSGSAVDKSGGREGAPAPGRAGRSTDHFGTLSRQGAVTDRPSRSGR